MKIIEKITLIIYSNLVLILSVLACLLIFRCLDIEVMQNLTRGLLFGEVSSKVVLGVSILFILLSIRCIFFDPSSKQDIKDRQGILLSNENGKLMISKETIENLVEAVTKEEKMAKEVSSRVEFDKENNINIFVNLVVNSNVVIKDLSVELQNKIKEKVKTVVDLDVKQVNITIKKVIEEKKAQ